MFCSGKAMDPLEFGNECTGYGVGDWSGSTVGNCCRLLSAGICLLVACNPVVAWDPK